MNKDKLKEYKKIFAENINGLAIYWVDVDKEITAKGIISWLISELEQCRTEITDLSIRIDYWTKRDTESLARAEKAETEIIALEKRIDDWRGLCDTEQITGMDWEERALKAETKLKQYGGTNNVRTNGSYGA